MYYSKIKKCDIADGTGVRVSLFVSGCRNHCKGCFQPETWDFKYGQEFSKKALDELVEALRPSYINGLTILGGDPMEPENQPTVLGICEAVKREFPEKDIWLYTGYNYEQFALEGFYVDDRLMEFIPRTYSECGFVMSPNPILKLIDVMVDGRFIEEQKDISLRFRGSKNQRIIDVKKSLEAPYMRAILWEDPNAYNDGHFLAGRKNNCD